MFMLRAQEDINTFFPPQHCCQLAQAVIRRVLQVGFGADKHEDMLYFLSVVM